LNRLVLGAKRHIIKWQRTSPVGFHYIGSFIARRLSLARHYGTHIYSSSSERCVCVCVCVCVCCMSNVYLFLFCIHVCARVPLWRSFGLLKNDTRLGHSLTLLLLLICIQYVKHHLAYNTHLLITQYWYSLYVTAVTYAFQWTVITENLECDLLHLCRSITSLIVSNFVVRWITPLLCIREVLLA
jgi:hypothetical protein